MVRSCGVELLRRHGIELELGPAASAPLDDVLDAAAAAWSAQRIATVRREDAPRTTGAGGGAADRHRRFGLLPPGV